MKKAGFTICVVGSLLAILFPPYLFLGSRHWGFFLTTLVSLFGKNIHVYDQLDFGVLALELLLINAFGIVLIAIGKRCRC